MMASSALPLIRERMALRLWCDDEAYGKRWYAAIIGANACDRAGARATADPELTLSVPTPTAGLSIKLVLILWAVCWVRCKSTDA